ncbi:unnamed protein product (macronuclear) [Paramecium tetraurelia]|uniref:Transmembrane protein n=1 Tax=Paramecium tetraurelia TaxID=5888 RepID=A0CB45_PARTE|nr:uncharacterized protein GSPATT00036795001 [Paramecium tetraurelia]CAK68012.1 unnamed protein product [Paramecium tetraurelia]|eukprot:XP_001435409.1 hypothetical protein (macronuclear) [Paramecium tetraurelia strain d4-2]
MEQLFKLINLLIHPASTQLQLKSIVVLIATINKAQELELVKNFQFQYKTEMNPILSIISYCFIIDSISSTQQVLIILFFFIVHIIFLLMFTYYYFLRNKSTSLQHILHSFLTYYELLFQIPILYSALSFIYDQEICNLSDFCASAGRIGMILIGSLNIIFALILNSIHIYFGRCEKLMEDNYILTLDYSIVFNGIMQVLLITSIILKSIDILPQLRFALLLIKSLTYIVTSINRINQFAYILVESIAISVNISISFNFSIYELFLIILFLLYLCIQIQNRVVNYYITLKQQQNLVTLQVLEENNEMSAAPKSKIILSIIKKNHVCKKCKNFHQIVECLLRRMANTSINSSQLYVLLYCSYVANHAPLKALIRVILMTSNDIYYKMASHNLQQELYKRTQQFQKEAQVKNSIRNANEHLNSLDVQSAFNTSHSASILFPFILETVNSKINFWNKLINGYNDIDHCLHEALKTTSKMLRCKKEFEDRFDMTNNKLKGSQSQDILSMRIIQIYQTGIYSNSFQAFQLEKAIDDLLKSERYKQDESLDNIQLIQNRLIILKSSLVRKRGELINTNSKQLSQFLCDSEDNVKLIKHCNQLMPVFLSGIHDQLMDNYLQNGHSKLMVHGESTFFQNLQGYIEPCNINLYNYFDSNKNDFLLNMILTKEQSNNETILFGIDGKILGFTKQFYDEALRSKTKIESSHMSKRSETTAQQIEIKELLLRYPLIQYYIPSITQQVEELRLQINSSSNYLMNNLRSYWIIPSNHNDCLLNSNLILSQFKRRSNGTQTQGNQRSYKSLTYSRYSQNSVNTNMDIYDDQEIPQEIRKQILIDNTPIMILHPEVQESVKKLVEFDTQSQYMQLGLFYSLSFKVLKYKKGTYAYFMISIKEMKHLQLQNSNQHFTTVPSQTTQQQSLYPTQDLNNSDLFLRNENAEIPESQNGMILEIKMMNQLKAVKQYDNDDLSNNLLDNSKSLEMSLKVKQSERSNIFDSNRQMIFQQPLYIKPRLLDKQCNQEFEQMENEMQGLKERQLELLDENEQEIVNEKFESNSQTLKKNSILGKLRIAQLQKKENAMDFASNPSRTSTNSTSKESLLIVQQLYYNTQLITPLKKIGFLLSMISLAILAVDIINVQLISSNLISQTEQVKNLRQPQDINYFYSSAMYQEWIQYVQSLKLISLSPFMSDRNTDVLASMYDFARAQMIDLAIQVPKQAQNLNINTVFNFKYIENGVIKYQDLPLQDFYQVIYQTAETSYRNNLGNESFIYPDMLTTGIIRVNLWQIIDLHNQLIQIIMQNTIDTQSSVRSYFLTVMMVQLFSVMLFIGLQLKYWLFIDHITKSILFLVSRINENQSIDQINRLTLIKEQLENESTNKWKLFNFGEVMFEYSDKKQKKVELKQAISIQSTQNSYRATSALYSRIQKTYYLNRTNVIITFLLAITWSAFLMAGYLIHMSYNDNFQPSLTVTLKFVQFRHNMDSLALIAGLTKTEPLIPNYNLSYINQTLSTSLLVDYKDNLLPLINEIADVILKNANENNQKSIFDGVLNYDLCLSTTLDNLPVCDLSKQSLAYDKKDIYLDIIVNGALGFTAAFVKFINQEYDYEINNLKYSPNIEECRITAQSQQFQNFVLQYFTDIQTAMRQFLILFQQDNSNISSSIISVIQVYYYGFGISLFAIYCTLSFIWIYKQQLTIQSLRQILVLIPVDLILTANIRSQAKEIHQMLY